MDFASFSERMTKIILFPLSYSSFFYVHNYIMGGYIYKYSDYLSTILQRISNSSKLFRKLLQIFSMQSNNSFRFILNISSFESVNLKILSQNFFEYFHAEF